ncbi:CHRD domain-containing protein [Hymenobacter cellulosivorans]|uniref:CHRD domain-containing protein n=1 Tax=Hymenobacter cellulosivorans TaxID=2932249 RepID=A0ABY4FEG1_9BACT|nr:CHRD domain-containing protein [Hymenobacter cellulosivorans]UOQ55073.1 CHRD domain-containing protein [Hymenobacter cellulosivorans]
MKKLLFALFLTMGSVAATSCSDDDTTVTPANQTISADLTGAQEVPAVTTSATGKITGTFNPTTKVLTYTVTFAGLTPSAGHMHMGGPGTTGPISFPFPLNSADGKSFVSPINGTVTLNDAQITALQGGMMYANLHTSANNGGEIRANVTMK